MCCNESTVQAVTFVMVLYSTNFAILSSNLAIFMSPISYECYDLKALLLIAFHVVLKGWGRFYLLHKKRRIYQP